MKITIFGRDRRRLVIRSEAHRLPLNSFLLRFKGIPLFTLELKIMIKSISPNLQTNFSHFAPEPFFRANFVHLMGYEKSLSYIYFSLINKF